MITIINITITIIITITTMTTIVIIIVTAAAQNYSIPMQKVDTLSPWGQTCEKEPQAYTRIRF